MPHYMQLTVGQSGCEVPVAEAPAPRCLNQIAAVPAWLRERRRPGQAALDQDDRVPVRRQWRIHWAVDRHHRVTGCEVARASRTRGSAPAPPTPARPSTRRRDHQSIQHHPGPRLDWRRQGAAPRSQPPSIMLTSRPRTPVPSCRHPSRSDRQAVHDGAHDRTKRLSEPFPGHHGAPAAKQALLVTAAPSRSSRQATSAPRPQQHLHR